MLLRWGIRGCGKISSDFVKALSLLPAGEHQVTAVCARSLQSAEQFRDAHGLSQAKAYSTDNNDFFQCDQIDVVYVGTLNHQHLDAVTAALNQAKHVLCEKPLALNETQVQQLVDCAKRNQRFLMEGYWTRFFPAMQKARQLIREGAIGQPVFINSNFNYHYVDYDDKFDPSKGGGTTLSLGCYTYSLPCFLLDSTQATNVQAIGTLTPSGCDNSVSVHLRLPNNVLVACLYSASSSTECQMTIGGTNGSIKIAECFWCPEEINIYKRVGRASELVETISHKVPERTGLTFEHPNSAGLSYEAEHVRQCIMKGCLQSEEMSWQESIDLARLSDTILAKMHTK